MIKNFTNSNRTLSVSGKIEVNGKTRNITSFRRSSAYIMQDDNLHPLLTVQEAMNIAANLKLDTSPAEKNQIVSFFLFLLNIKLFR